MAEDAPTVPSVDEAVEEVLSHIQHLEEADGFEKLKERVSFHFRKAGKKIEVFGKSFPDLAAEYADNAFSSVFASLGEKEWLPEIDFVPVFVSAFAQRFPKFVSKPDFEETAVNAAEKAADEKMFENHIWEVMQSFSDDKKVRSKVSEAVEMARNSAKAVFAKSTDQSLDAFATRWISAAIGSLKASTGGNLEPVLPVEKAVELFTTLFDKGCTPKSVTSISGEPPSPWPLVESTVADAFLQAEAQKLEKPGEGALAGQPALKRARGRAEGYGSRAPSGAQAMAWQEQIMHLKAHKNKY